MVGGGQGSRRSRGGGGKRAGKEEGVRSRSYERLVGVYLRLELGELLLYACSAVLLVVQLVLQAVDLVFVLLQLVTQREFLTSLVGEIFLKNVKEQVIQDFRTANESEHQR